jgi:DNA-binding PadR family transcriptional regulator
MARRTASPTHLSARSNDPTVLILTSLVSGSKHGWALTKDIEDFSGIALGPGTLYGAITRLEERGLIEPLPVEDRRRPYRISASGRAALTEAVREMRTLVDTGEQRLGLRTLARSVGCGSRVIGSMP